MPDRWMTYEDAGKLLGGLSAEAMRKRARRLGWRIQAGNEGKALVLVPDGAELRLPGRPAGDRPDKRGGDRPDELVAELRRRAETAEARSLAAEVRAGTAEARAHQLAGELAAQHERAGRLEGERDAARAEAAARRDAEARERERADAALERALAAEARLETGSPGARALKAWRAFLARRRGA